MKKSILLIALLCVFLSLATCQKYSGKAITPEIEASIVELIKKSFLLNGRDYQKNLVFLQTNLQNIYPRTWNVMITPNAWQNNYQCLNYSMNGQWWMHWYKANPYATDWIYGMQRVNETYDPQNTYIGYLHSVQFGKGWSSVQQQKIKNILSVNQSADKLKTSLNQNVQKGNWNIIGNQNLAIYLNIKAKQNKWFSYYANEYYYFGFLS